MKITIHSTTRVVTLSTSLDSVRARIWEGETESGIKVHCYVTRIAIDEKETRVTEFERELEEQAPPSA
ncbi:MAG TPA: hypothetical protein VGH22_15420, partial [Candidatus Binatia bacterium]